MRAASMLPAGCKRRWAAAVRDVQHSESRIKEKRAKFFMASIPAAQDGRRLKLAHLKACAQPAEHCQQRRSQYKTEENWHG